MRRLVAALIATGAVVLAAAAPALAHEGLSLSDRAQLRQIARDTWRFYGTDVDPATQLPMDNIGPGTTEGTYTSAANIGVYLWAVVAARDLHLIDTHKADALAAATLTEVAASSATTASCTSGMTPAPRTRSSTPARPTARRRPRPRTTAGLSRRSTTAGTRRA